MRRETVLRIGRGLAVLVVWSLVVAPLSLVLPTWFLSAATLGLIVVAVSIATDRTPRR